MSAEVGEFPELTRLCLGRCNKSAAISGIGRSADVVGKAVRDPKPTFERYANTPPCGWRAGFPRGAFLDRHGRSKAQQSADFIE